MFGAPLVMSLHEMAGCYREAITLYHETLDSEVLELVRSWESLLFRKHGVAVEFAC